MYSYTCINILSTRGVEIRHPYTTVKDSPLDDYLPVLCYKNSFIYDILLLYSKKEKYYGKY